MKWILCILIVCSQNIYTMGLKCPGLMKSCIIQLTSLVHKKSSLTEEDLQKATRLIKEIRAQSPASGFVCETHLQEKIISQDIETDSRITPPMGFAKENLFRRNPSPLILNGIIS